MDQAPTNDGARRSTLLGIKLRALVGDHLGAPVDAEPETFRRGAALLVGPDAWVLIDGDASRSLGMALAWAVRREAAALNVVVDAAGGMLARRAARFTLPIAVWVAHDRTLVPVAAERLHPPPVAAAAHRTFSEMIAAAGASPNVEHGIVSGEVRGLEVCRVVDQPTVGVLSEPGVDAAVLDTRPVGVQLEVGVGAADREGFQMLHGDLPTSAALATVVDAVETHRSAGGGGQHPLNRLGRERFLRWRAEQAPETVGLVELAAAEPPVPRANLKDPVPCVAVGSTAAGETVAVVFSAGVDLDLLPFVADVQEMGHRRILVALPRRDLLPMTRQIAALLVEPIEFITFDA